MSRVRWGPSEDGFVESKCGEWKITPLYWGCTRPQSFELWRFNGDGPRTRVGFYETQKEAKVAAEALVSLDRI